MGSAQLRRHLLQDLRGTHTARNSQLGLFGEPVRIELELPVNRTSNPSGPVIRALPPHPSDLCGTLCFQHFETSKPAGSSTDILVVGRDFQRYKNVKGFTMTK